MDCANGLLTFFKNIFIVFPLRSGSLPFTCGDHLHQHRLLHSWRQRSYQKLQRRCHGPFT